MDLQQKLCGLANVITGPLPPELKWNERIQLTNRSRRTAHKTKSFTIRNTNQTQQWNKLMLKWKLINNSFETLIWQKRKSPLVRVEPNASCLPDKHPRLLDHRGFLICHRSLIRVIHMWSLLWLLIIYMMSSAHPIHAVLTTAHLFCTSAWMVHHHLNNLILKCFISMKINK